jgi:hypothetical protein
MMKYPKITTKESRIPAQTVIGQRPAYAAKKHNKISDSAMMD